MSRSPIARLRPAPTATGGGSPGRGRPRQGTSSSSRRKTVSEARLAGDAARRGRTQKKPYGLLFETSPAASPMTGRGGLQAFKVSRSWSTACTPTAGRTSWCAGSTSSARRWPFSEDPGRLDRPAVFNGYCGAESGCVPVSAVVPSLCWSRRSRRSERRSPRTGRLCCRGRPPRRDHDFSPPLLLLSLLCAWVLAGAAQAPVQDDALLRAMRAEVDRARATCAW